MTEQAETAPQGEVWIIHDRTNGTIAYNHPSDGAGKILIKHNFRPDRSGSLPEHPEHGQGYWYVQQSRRRRHRRWVDEAAAALTEAGYLVHVEIDDVTPCRIPFADYQEEQYARIDAKADKYEQWAGSWAERGNAQVTAASEFFDSIPFGQPIMGVRDRNRRAKQSARMDSGFAKLNKASGWDERAATARRFQGRKENIPTTLRRIEELEAEQRRISRAMQGHTVEDRAETIGTTIVDHQDAVRIPGSAHRMAVYRADLAELDDELGYWREFVAVSGQKVWGRGDFAKGDLVDFGYGWFEVVKVNAKSLTVPAMAFKNVSPHTAEGVRKKHGRLITDTIRYDKVRNQMPAAQARQKFPDAWPKPDPRADKRPGKKRGKVKLEHRPGALAETWWFAIKDPGDTGEGLQYRATWPHPREWHTKEGREWMSLDPWQAPGQATDSDPRTIRLYILKPGHLSKYDLIAQWPVTLPDGVTYVEEIHNIVRDHVEEIRKDTITRAETETATETGKP